MQEADDALLVRRALADDTRAFTVLVERHYAMALWLALRSTGEREIAQELVQEALLQAYLSLYRLLKIRARLRIHLQKNYPDMQVVQPRKYRRTIMVPMTLARVQAREQSFHTTVVLVDQPRRRALALWFTTERDTLARMRMFASPEQQAAAAEPLTTGFLLNVLRALHGTLDGIEIDVLTADILYARVKLHGPDGVSQQVKARLENALPLAIETRCPLDVAEAVLERQGVNLVDFGATYEQQLDALENRARQAFPLSASQALAATKVPRNLDFSDDFRGWSLMGLPDRDYTYQLDTTVTYRHKQSLLITLQEGEHTTVAPYSLRSVYLIHEGFAADNYRGKRLRMTCSVRAEQVKQGVLNLHVNGPARSDENMERRTMYMATNQYRPVEGTTSWQRYEVVIDVPEDASTIQCGFNLSDGGKVWLDGFQFEEVDASVPLTGTRIMPPPLQPINLTFARNFDGWLTAGSKPQDYTRALESSEQGTPVVSLKNAIEQPRGTIALQQIVNAHDYRGRTVRIVAEIRTESVAQRAGLYLAQSIMTNDRLERTIQGTTGWQSYEITQSIPDEPGQIEFGVILSGPGQVWLRNLQFSVQP